jgi:hypothetical protein
MEISMTNKVRLFTATRWLLMALLAFSVFVEVVLIVALGCVLAAWSGLDGGALGIPAVLEGDIARADALRIGAWALAAGMAIFLLVALVVRAVKAIVETAIGGDPFVASNAQRLTRIGWFLVALLAVELAASRLVNGMIGRLAAAHHASANHIGHFDMGSDVSPLGLLAILLVFVLAQIFRHGSEMRAELESTV